MLCDFEECQRCYWRYPDCRCKEGFLSASDVRKARLANPVKRGPDRRLKQSQIKDGMYCFRSDQNGLWWWWWKRDRRIWTRRKLVSQEERNVLMGKI